MIKYLTNLAGILVELASAVGLYAGGTLEEELIYYIFYP